MNLPNIFSTNVDPNRHLFFAIHIADGFVQSALWEVSEGMIHVLTESEKHEWKSDEECVESIDTCLQELGKESEDVKETLFSLSNEWVNSQGILPEKKPLFQKITKELSLSAVGFVVTVEAVVQHIAQFGTPHLQMFFIEMSLTHLYVSLVKSGQIAHTEKVGRSGDSVSDITEAFAHFSEKVFPAKILLFSTTLSSEEVEESQQQLVKHVWNEQYPFLHPPVIEVYPSDHVLEVVVQTGGLAVAEAKKLNLVKQNELSATHKPAAMGLMETGESPSTHEETAVDELEQQDHLERAHADTDAIPTASTFNIPVAPDVAELATHGANMHTEHQFGDEDIHQEHKSKMNFFHNHHVPILPFAIGGVISGLVILTLVAFITAKNVVVAVVDVQLKSQNLNKEVELTLDSKIAQSDYPKLLLKAQIINKQIEGEKTAETTGKKVIGDKAKGKVTIFNRTSSSKSFSAGTVMKTGKVSYTLDQTVTVASASTGQNFETKPGTVEAAVTAAAIGTDSNIAKDTDLLIESFSKDTYVARTSGEISGGSSREIEAVSQKDRDNLLVALKKELNEKAAEELKSQAEGGQYVIPTNRMKVLSSTYSAEVGKETNSFSLKLKVEVEAMAYHSKDLKPLATQVLSPDLPPGYQFGTEEPDIISSPVTSSTASAQIKLVANVSAKAYPSLEEQKIKDEIRGKTEQEATNILRNTPEVQSATVAFSPPILKRLSSSIPKNMDKIVVRITK